MKQTIDCERCEGKGYLNGYSHVQGGVCFKCGGSGNVTKTVKSAAQLAREAAKRETKKTAQQAETAVRVTEFKRKRDRAIELYRNDSRLRVTADHAWFAIHCQELAEKDKVWGTL